MRNSFAYCKMRKVSDAGETSSMVADMLSRILINCFGLLLLSLGVISGSLGGVIGTLTGVSISGYYMGSIGKCSTEMKGHFSHLHFLAFRCIYWPRNRFESNQQCGRCHGRPLWRPARRLRRYCSHRVFHFLSNRPRHRPDRRRTVRRPDWRFNFATFCGHNHAVIKFFAQITFVNNTHFWSRLCNQTDCVPILVI